MRQIWWLLCIAALAGPPAFAQDEAAAEETPASAAQHYIGGLGFYVIADDDRGPGYIDDGYGFLGLYGYQFADSGFGFEIRGSTETFETGDIVRTDYYLHDLGVDAIYAFGDRKVLVAYLAGGGGGNFNDVLMPDGDEYAWFLEAGGGLVFRPTEAWPDLRIRGDARYVYDGYDGYDSGFGDIRLALGLEFGLFGEDEVPPAAPQEVAVVETVEVSTGLKDSDGDGVVDESDKCPDTPAGTRVDGDGCPLAKVIELKGVTFEFNKTRLRPDAQTILDWAVGILKKYPDMKVEVAGHTDNVGGDAYNQKLSERRAQAVQTYFVEHGVPADQATVKGYGESEPVVDNGSELGRERNRRVELRVLN